MREQSKAAALPYSPRHKERSTLLNAIQQAPSSLPVDIALFVHISF